MLAGLIAMRKMHIHAIEVSGLTCADAPVHKMVGMLGGIYRIQHNSKVTCSADNEDAVCDYVSRLTVVSDWSRSPTFYPLDYGCRTQIIIIYSGKNVNILFSHFNSQIWVDNFYMVCYPKLIFFTFVCKSKK